MEEGPEGGVKWELGFAFSCTGKMRFTAPGLGFNPCERDKQFHRKIGMGFLSFHGLRLYYLTQLPKCAHFLN